MWPYNEDEAGWLKPREDAEPPRRASANDNGCVQLVPAPKPGATAVTAPAPNPAPKS
jgi:hypothetical protein